VRIHTRNGKLDWATLGSKRKLAVDEPRATDTSGFGGLTQMSEGMVADVLGCSVQNVQQAERSALRALRSSPVAPIVRDFLRDSKWSGGMSLWNGNTLSYRVQSAWRDKIARWLMLADIIDLECPLEAARVRVEVTRLVDWLRSK
jgi:hypothetical protein